MFLRPKREVVIELVEQNNVETSYPVALIETSVLLLVKTLDCLPVATVHRCFKWEVETCMLLLLNG